MKCYSDQAMAVNSDMQIQIDDLTRNEVQTLVTEYFNKLQQLVPSASSRMLSYDKLQKPNVQFWTIWEGEILLGCGALKELDPTHGEVKSMYVCEDMRRKGVARKLLEHIITESKLKGFRRISLETGRGESFVPAHKLYESFGFNYCEPYGEYPNDSNSTYMSLEIE